jgi:osmotically inducible protein OsmC
MSGDQVQAAGATDTDPAVRAFATRLRELRDERGWSLADLAAATNLSRTFLSRLETAQRQPSLGVLLALARAYGVHVSDLVEEEASPQLLHRRAELTWDADASGRLKLASEPGANAFSFEERLAETGSNPEELMAAAQAACAAMSLYNLLRARGTPARRIRARTDVQLEHFGGMSAVVGKVDVLLEAEVPGLSASAFARIAQAVKRYSPVAKALAGANVEIHARPLRPGEGWSLSAP